MTLSNHLDAIMSREAADGDSDEDVVDPIEDNASGNGSDHDRDGGWSA